MGARKKAKKKSVKKVKVPDTLVPESIFEDIKNKLHEAVELIKQVIENPEIEVVKSKCKELLIKWEILKV